MYKYLRKEPSKETRPQFIKCNETTKEEKLKQLRVQPKDEKINIHKPAHKFSRSNNISTDDINNSMTLNTNQKYLKYSFINKRKFDTKTNNEQNKQNSFNTLNGNKTATNFYNNQINNSKLLENKNLKKTDIKFGFAYCKKNPNNDDKKEEKVINSVRLNHKITTKITKKEPEKNTKIKLIEKENNKTMKTSINMEEGSYIYRKHKNIKSSVDIIPKTPEKKYDINLNEPESKTPLRENNTINNETKIKSGNFYKFKKYLRNGNKKEKEESSILKEKTDKESKKNINEEELNLYETVDNKNEERPEKRGITASFIKRKYITNKNDESKNDDNKNKKEIQEKKDENKKLNFGKKYKKCESIKEESIENEIFKINNKKDKNDNKENLNIADDEIYETNEKGFDRPEKRGITISYIKRKYINKTEEDLPPKKIEKPEIFKIERKKQKTKTVCSNFVPNLFFKSSIFNIGNKFKKKPYQKIFDDDSENDDGQKNVKKIKDVRKENNINKLNIKKILEKKEQKKYTKTKNEIKNKQEKNKNKELKKNTKIKKYNGLFENEIIEDESYKRKKSFSYSKSKYLNKTDEDVKKKIIKPEEFKIKRRKKKLHTISSVFSLHKNLFATFGKKRFNIFKFEVIDPIKEESEEELILSSERNSYEDTKKNEKTLNEENSNKKTVDKKDITDLILTPKTQNDSELDRNSIKTRYENKNNKLSEKKINNNNELNKSLEQINSNKVEDKVEDIKYRTINNDDKRDNEIKTRSAYKYRFRRNIRNENNEEKKNNEKKEETKIEEIKNESKINKIGNEKSNEENSNKKNKKLILNLENNFINDKENKLNKNIENNIDSKNIKVNEIIEKSAEKEKNQRKYKFNFKRKEQIKEEKLNEIPKEEKIENKIKVNLSTERFFKKENMFKKNNNIKDESHFETNGNSFEKPNKLNFSGLKANNMGIKINNKTRKLENKENKDNNTKKIEYIKNIKENEINIKLEVSSKRTLENSYSQNRYSIKTRYENKNNKLSEKKINNNNELNKSLEQINSNKVEDKVEDIKYRTINNDDKRDNEIKTRSAYKYRFRRNIRNENNEEKKNNEKKEETKIEEIKNESKINKIGNEKSNEENSNKKNKKLILNLENNFINDKENKLNKNIENNIDSKNIKVNEIIEKSAEKEKNQRKYKFNFKRKEQIKEEKLNEIPKEEKIENKIKVNLSTERFFKKENMFKKNNDEDTICNNENQKSFELSQNNSLFNTTGKNTPIKTRNIDFKYEGKTTKKKFAFSPSIRNLNIISILDRSNNNEIKFKINKDAVNLENKENKNDNVKKEEKINKSKNIEINITVKKEINSKDNDKKILVVSPLNQNNTYDKEYSSLRRRYRNRSDISLEKIIDKSKIDNVGKSLEKINTRNEKLKYDENKTQKTKERNNYSSGFRRYIRKQNNNEKENKIDENKEENKIEKVKNVTKLNDKIYDKNIEENSNKQNIYEKSVEKENEKYKFKFKKIEPIKESLKEIHNKEEKKINIINEEKKEIGSPKNKKDITVSYIKNKYLNKTDEDLPIKNRKSSEEFNLDKKNIRRQTLSNNFIPKIDIKSFIDKSNNKILFDEIPKNKNKTRNIIKENIKRVNISEISEQTSSEEEINIKDDIDDLYEDDPNENKPEKRGITVSYIKKKYLNKTDEDIPIKTNNEDFKHKIKPIKRNSLFTPSFKMTSTLNKEKDNENKFKINKDAVNLENKENKNDNVKKEEKINKSKNIEINITVKKEINSKDNDKKILVVSPLNQNNTYDKEYSSLRRRYRNRSDISLEKIIDKSKIDNVGKSLEKINTRNEKLKYDENKTQKTKERNNYSSGFRRYIRKQNNNEKENKIDENKEENKIEKVKNVTKLNDKIYDKNIEENSNKQNIYEKSVEKENEKYKFKFKKIEPIKESLKEIHNKEEKKINIINEEKKEIGSPKNKKDITVSYIKNKYLNKTDEDLPIKNRKSSEEFNLDKKNIRRQTLSNNFIPKIDIKSFIDKSNNKILFDEIPKNKNKTRNIIKENIKRVNISEISEQTSSEEEINIKDDIDDLYEDDPNENKPEKRGITVSYIKKKYLNKTDEDIPIKTNNEDFKHKIKPIKRNSLFTPSFKMTSTLNKEKDNENKFKMNIKPIKLNNKTTIEKDIENNEKTEKKKIVTSNLKINETTKNKKQTALENIENDVMSKSKIEKSSTTSRYSPRKKYLKNSNNKLIDDFSPEIKKDTIKNIAENIIQEDKSQIEEVKKDSETKIRRSYKSKRFNKNKSTEQNKPNNIIENKKGTKIDEMTNIKSIIMKNADEDIENYFYDNPINDKKEKNVKGRIYYKKINNILKNEEKERAKDKFSKEILDNAYKEINPKLVNDVNKIESNKLKDIIREKNIKKRNINKALRKKLPKSEKRKDDEEIVICTFGTNQNKSCKRKLKIDYSIIEDSAESIASNEINPVYELENKEILSYNKNEKLSKNKIISEVPKNFTELNLVKQSENPIKTENKSNINQNSERIMNKTIKKTNNNKIETRNKDEIKKVTKEDKKQNKLNIYLNIPKSRNINKNIENEKINNFKKEMKKEINSRNTYTERKSRFKENNSIDKILNKVEKSNIRKILAGDLSELYDEVVQNTQNFKEDLFFINLIDTQNHVGFFDKGRKKPHLYNDVDADKIVQNTLSSEDLFRKYNARAKSIEKI